MTENSNHIESLIESEYVLAINEHRNHDALLVAILGFLISSRCGGADSSVGLIQAAASIILEEKGATLQACSFCGQKPPKVKLGTGNKGETPVYICNECVETFRGAFSQKP